MRFPLNLGSDVLRLGTRVVLILLTAQALTLVADDKEKEKEKGKKHEVARPEPRREAPPAPRPEPRREAPPSSRPEPRPMPRMEPRPESRPEPRPMPRPEPRLESRPEPRPMPRPEPRHDLSPAPHPQPHSPTLDPGTPRDHTPNPRPAPGPTPGRLESNPRHLPPPTGHLEPTRPTGPAGRPGFEARPGPGPLDRRQPDRQVIRTQGGGEIHRTHTGVIREVRTPSGAVIRHSPSGVRHVEIVRPGGRIIVANATGRHGYIQRPLVSHGHTYVQRTYIIEGRPHAALYRPWSYSGREYNVYMPRHYYRPGFYVWAYDPWPRPVRYTWGWHNRPWYGYYGGYFTPYPVYAGPAFWLTDFLIAATLESAFLAQNATMSAPPVTYTSSTAMSPEVKEAIAEEVRRQMNQARAEQASQGASQPMGAPPIFSKNGPKVFLVSSSLLAYAGSQECPLGEGDVLQLVETPALGSEWAEVKVLSSRGSSCQKGSYISVRTTELQEMQNHLAASMENGMAKLQADQGKEGIPALPAQARGIVKASYSDDIQPDLGAQSELALAVKEANSSEQAIIDERPQEPAGVGGTISLGMTIPEVERTLGQPRQTVDLGKKKIYVYKDLKITFLGGKVSDVQ